jgi:hypothetical protein
MTWKDFRDTVDPSHKILPAIPISGSRYPFPPGYKEK